MRHARLSLLLAALAAPASVLAQAACPDREIEVQGGCASLEAAAEAMRMIVGQAIEAEGMTATIVRASVNGAPLLTESWGESMSGVPATTDMHFRAGAVAIAYLGTLLLQLQEQGVLSTEDRLSKWFPEYPHAEEVTLAMLANNSAGYADYVNLDVLPLFDNVFRHWQPEELIKIALAQDMACAPGTCFSYAHTNYVILGQVFETATGRPLAEVIREQILVPLGLNDTRSEDTALIAEPVLHAYDDERGLFEESTYWSPSWTLARGAIMTSSIYDLERSAIAIGTGRLLSEVSLETMLAPRTAGLTPLSPQLYYGLGVVVNNGWVMQNPSFYGYGAVMAYHRPTGVSIAIATTQGPDTPDRPNERLFAKLAAYLAPNAPPLERP
jgi:D-alanyl-D-alanine carboxypeptidase